MNVDVVIFVLGCLIVSASILYSINSNKNKNDDAYLNNLHQYNRSMSLNNKSNGDLDKIKKEISTLKKELTTVFEILNSVVMSSSTESSADANIIKKTDIQESSFSNILNYSKFLNNNKDIVERYKNKKSIEEIAKELNKSIREVEMVVKMIK